MNHDPINHPAHYQSASGVECIDVAEHLSFNLGNAFKYIFRRDGKGRPVEDLGKARWYCIREQGRWERLGGLWAPRPFYPPLEVLIQAVAGADKSPKLGTALLLIGLAEWSPRRLQDVRRAITLIERSIDDLKAEGAAG